ncbi:SAF domain-containing protein [Micromonospora sp. CP22]|uniref:SAF domain-containing protein n=1 Tax=Micromonospora sp. CP22 TaxID=2580517 RepID=UPI0012BD2D6D|nr:SAF domain-containing protein [Micromonospora sp. CP22]MTK03547.1 hypothetical protein [Micromonospora sp. CP22]
MTTPMEAATGVRAVVAAGGSSCPPLAAPNAVAPGDPRRRWRPASAWLALALLSTVGLIAVSVLPRGDTTDEYLAVSTRVEAGSLIDRSHLTTVRITTDPALTPIRASAADDVVGRYASVTLVPGTLLTRAQLTDVPVPDDGRRLVGLNLPTERLPTERVAPGAEVRLVVTVDDAVVSHHHWVSRHRQPPTPTSIEATVVDMRVGDTAGTTLLNVAVAECDRPLVVSGAAAGRIAVALAARK